MKKSFGRKVLFLVIIVLFIGSGVLPSMGGAIIEIRCLKDNMTPFIDLNPCGNILYVGGSGQGNYTSIQNAINDASDGDMVFVYSYSSPYYENVVLDKTINLIGENKDTTVIDGGACGDVVKIDWNWVIISGFTIQNSGEYDRGIYIGSNQNNIYDNIILNNGIGIDLRFSCNNTINNNNINSNIKYGIYIYKSNRNIITYNKISLNGNIGIILRGSNYNTISDNIIDSNKYHGIYITADTVVPTLKKIPSEFNNINSNHISLNNGCGIYILNSRFNIILKNNFLDNVLVALVKSPLFYKNQWKQNYWNEPRILPKFIYRKIIISGFGIPPSFIVYLPWFDVDWRPALKPYDI